MKKLRVFSLVLAVLLSTSMLLACGEKTTMTKDQDGAKEDLDQLRLEAKKARAYEASLPKEDSMKDKRVVLCSENIVKVFELLGYEDVVGIPADVQSDIYDSAVRIESYDKEGLIEVKSHDPEIYFAESFIEYDVYPNEYSNKQVKFYNFEDLEATKSSIIYIGRDLGIENKAREIAENLEVNL